MDQSNTIIQGTQTVTLATISYGGWPACLRLSDSRTEAIITTDVGPRVIRFGFVGGQNMFKEYAPQIGLTGGSDWRIYGGHRLWIAPEDPKRTSVPDNESVQWNWDGKTLSLHQSPDPQYAIQKELRLQYMPDGSLRVGHRLTNKHSNTTEVSPWAISVMATGGEAVLPQEPPRDHLEALLPVRTLALWAYTDMSDPRWTWGSREIRLRQNPHIRTPQKIGMYSTRGWMAYQLLSDTFIRQHTRIPNASYPDLGCNVEVYTDHEMLELESLGPLVRLKPGEHTDLEEQWSLNTSQGRLRDTISSLLPVMPNQQSI